MPRRRFRIRLPFLAAVIAVVVAVVGYIVGLAHWQASQTALFEPGDLYVPRSIDVVIAAWCVWVGSSIGSFLNVVAWRMPRGETINGRSHCPRCQTQLRARDNFPIFGWLALGGRCRQCRLPISPRYPIVEAAVGLTIALVALSELYRLSLPRQSTHWHGGPLWTPAVDAPILLTLLYHVVALSVAWAIGLIRMDGHRLPARLIAFAAATVALPLLVYPTLMVVPWQTEVDSSWHPTGLYVDAVMRVLTALVAATVLARFLARTLCPAADPKLDPLGEATRRLIDLVILLAIPSLVAGWQAAPAITVLASVIAALLGRCLPGVPQAYERFAIALPPALTVQLVLWRWLHAVDSETGRGDFSLWPSDQNSPWVFLGWCGLILLTPLWLRDRAES